MERFPTEKCFIRLGTGLIQHLRKQSKSFKCCVLRESCFVVAAVDLLLSFFDGDVANGFVDAAENGSCL